MSAGAVAEPEVAARLRVVPRASVSLATAGVIALTVVAALLRFWRLGHQSFWYDEAFTSTLVHHSAGTMLGLLPRTELTLRESSGSREFCPKQQGACETRGSGSIT